MMGLSMHNVSEKSPFEFPISEKIKAQISWTAAQANQRSFLLTRQYIF